MLDCIKFQHQSTFSSVIQTHTQHGACACRGIHRSGCHYPCPGPAPISYLSITTPFGWPCSPVSGSLCSAMVRLTTLTLMLFARPKASGKQHLEASIRCRQRCRFEHIRKRPNRHVQKVCRRWCRREKGLKRHRVEGVHARRNERAGQWRSPRGFARRGGFEARENGADSKPPHW